MPATPVTKKGLGRQGEQAAVAYLRGQGYHIETTNWRCRHGEIDIVARQADTLVFIEVRTRRAGVEAAFESITPRKQTKLRALAYAYLSAHGLENMPWRIDLIAVALPRGGPPLIEHLEDGLSW